ncbi:MAG: hypothetical protein SGJ09_09965 [Phycisphaerae bacterium]|nr:hypothetical protein [Phycisphaerae bacterium]
MKITGSIMCSLVSLLSLTVIGSTATSALAQAQLGSGHALDASLQVGSGGYNGVVYRGGVMGAPGYIGGYGGGFTSSYGSGYTGPTGSASRYVAGASKYSPYTGGAGQNIQGTRNFQGTTNEDTYLNDKAYSAGWQRKSGGYSSYAGPPTGTANSSTVGAWKINGKVGG